MQSTTSITSDNPRIKMYRQRSVGECVTATFDFVKENWKVLLRFASYLLVPLALVQGVLTNMNPESGANGITSIFMFSSFGVLAVYLVSYVLVTALVYSLMTTYEEREQRLSGITFDDIKPRLLKNGWRIVVLILTGILFGGMGLLLTYGLVNILSGFIILPLWFFVMVFAIPATMILPVYLFEECSVSEAIAKGFRLGFSAWGSLFGFLILMTIITTVVSGVMEGPLSILLFLKVLLMENDDLSNYRTLLSLGGLAAATISSYISFMVATLMPIGTAYMYGSVSEREDGLTNARDIENFEEMSQKRFDDIEDFDKTDELI
jgi:hypothetical protein